MSTERTVFAQDALDHYLAQPVSPVYEGVPAEELQTITETDAFNAGWDASVDHLQAVVKGMDIPGPLKAIIENLLDSNRSERDIKV